MDSWSPVDSGLYDHHCHRYSTNYRLLVPLPLLLLLLLLLLLQRQRYYGWRSNSFPRCRLAFPKSAELGLKELVTGTANGPSP